MAISNRLKTIAELVTPGYRAADIGTDHGYVPIYLLRNGICSYAIAADLSTGSLEKARDNAHRAGLLIERTDLPGTDETKTDKKAFPLLKGVECRLSDGLAEIRPGEVDSIVISGMGGILMDRILRDGLDVVRAAKELILSPHRDVPLLREFAKEYGFDIVEDIEMVDKKKTYTILKIKIS